MESSIKYKMRSQKILGKIRAIKMIKGGGDL